MFERQKTGSVVCPGCGRLVGVQDERCWNCGRARPSLFGFSRALQNLGNEAVFSTVVIAICVVIFVLELLMSPRGINTQLGFGFLAPDLEMGVRFGASGALIVFDYGRWWTILSAGWLHGGLLHIAFNMYWVHQLGPVMARLFGVPRAAIIYLLSSAMGFLVTSAMPVVAPWMPFANRNSVTLGASAAVFGWLGALICYSRQTGGRMFMRQVMGMAIPLVLFGLLIPGIDNWAHLGGLAGGYLLASRYGPNTEERPGQVLTALVLLVVSLLAVPLSFLSWSF
ncbi:MAG: rhomboid family intramembrane serine protease [Acidobacteriota bacterium]|nr:rhomboid family intramembrane serine protease [Acidobacteriota bacterium]MDE2921704.1 rhomboid family intramembrane serine protease [Acidobacteriota bacterium]MDE3266619.1 rhomboid family intramembrane serine protease [Acidobacteriota bacterium]